ncbi:hypothetical protein [Nonlabens tegetincola]|nr:hypothetical protein [Nonlabens tegetincola]
MASVIQYPLWGTSSYVNVKILYNMNIPTTSSRLKWITDYST